MIGSVEFYTPENATKVVGLVTNKCVPISKARGGGGPGFLDRGFKFIKGGSIC